MKYFSGRDCYVSCAGARLRHGFAMSPHAPDVKFNGFTNEALGLFARISRRDAAWEIGYISGISISRLFNYHRVLHFFSPACFKTLFNVPGGRSLEGWPDTVTVPGLTECRNCRWLPRVRSSRQPSSSII